jgi:capsular exopolysaccharide synthesis family protein
MVKTLVKPNIIMLTNPDSLVSEMYRSLRFNIECAAKEREVKTIAITSAVKGEGKTTTAINLAIAFAKSGKRVLLIDANLRDPALHLAFPLNMDSGLGLSSFLLNKNEMKEIIQRSEIENLSILLAGNLPPNPSDLLSSESMNTLLVQLKSSYDVILIDTPPLLRLTDAKIVSSMCDGVLLVLQHGKVKREITKQVKEDLARVKAYLLGIVMNRTKNKEI